MLFCLYISISLYQEHRNLNSKEKENLPISYSTPPPPPSMIIWDLPLCSHGSCQKSILQPLFFQNLQLSIFLWQLRIILLVLRSLNIKIFSLMCLLQVTQCMPLCSPPRIYIRMFRDYMLGKILMTTPQT